MHTLENAVRTTYGVTDDWEPFIKELRSYSEALNEQGDMEEGGIFIDLPDSMTKRLREFVPSNVSVAVLAIMQELGLIRIVKKGRNTLWQAADISLFDDFVTEEMVTRAVGNMIRHRERADELKKLRQAQEEPAPLVPNDELTQEIVKTVAELENVKSKLAQANDEIAQLKAKPNADVSEELAKMLRKARGDDG